MKERVVAYGRFDCKNEKGYTEMLAVIEYEEVMGIDIEGQLIKIGERECGCFDVLRKLDLQKGHYFRNLSVLIDDSITCYGKYRGFRIYEVPREIRKDT